MVNVRISAFGKSVPERIMDNAFLETMVDTTHEWIHSRTGIAQRRISCCEGENVSGLCTNAARDILQKKGIAPGDVDLIVVATMTPDYLTPSAACLVQRNLGAVNAMAFDINGACSGFVFALRTAWAYLKAGIYKNALVLGADVLSKVLNWQDRSTCVLFGDGAGGVLLEAGGFPCDSFGAWDIHSDGARGESLTAHPLPVDNPFVRERPALSGGVDMDGRKIFDFALKTIPKSIRLVLDESGCSLADIQWIVPHQANYRITAAIAKKLGVDVGKFYMNIHAYGNTVAGSIPIALSEMAEQGLIRPGSGEKMIVTGFGGGLTWGSVLINI